MSWCGKEIVEGSVDMNKDLTTGRPERVLWSFALPMLLSVAFQQVYSIADSVIVGKFISGDALAAVSSSYPITMIFIAIATGFSTGAGVVISRQFGGGEYGKMRTSSSTSVISAVVASAVLSLLGLILAAPVLKLLDTNADIMGDSVLYLNIYCYGLIFLFLYNICNGIFTALGDSRTPLMLLIFSSVLNIVLDLFFVISLRWGVGGAAWATLIAQGLSSVLAWLLLMQRLRRIETDEGYSRFSLRALRTILKIAVPSILQTSFVSVGNLFIQARVNYFGVDVVAGYGAAIKLNTFAVTCFTTVSSAVSSYTAQNMGAKHIDRVVSGLRAGIKMMLIIAIPFTLLFTVFGGGMMGLFAGESDAAIVEIGQKMLLIITPFYIFVGAKIVCDGILRGSGAIYAFTTSTLIDLVLRVVLCYIFSVFWEATGIWLAWPVGWVISTFISYGFYISGRWKKY